MKNAIEEKLTKLIHEYGRHLLGIFVLVLLVHAWAAGRSARLRGRQLLVTTSIAAGLGLAMILLKDVVLTHVH